MRTVVVPTPSWGTCLAACSASVCVTPSLTGIGLTRTAIAWLVCGTLDDIEDLLHLADGGPASCEEARTMARTRIADLQQRINELAGMRDALTQLVDTCDQPRAERECPILHDIETAANTTAPPTRK